MKDEAFENSVIYHHGQGWSIRRLAREFRCGRSRILRILRENEQRRTQGVNPLVTPRVYPSKLDPYKEHIHDLLQKFGKSPRKGSMKWYLRRDIPERSARLRCM
jgi:transposase